MGGGRTIGPVIHQFFPLAVIFTHVKNRKSRAGGRRTAVDLMGVKSVGVLNNAQAVTFGIDAQMHDTSLYRLSVDTNLQYTIVTYGEGTYGE